MRVRVVTRGMRGLLSVRWTVQAVEASVVVFNWFRTKYCAGWCRYSWCCCCCQHSVGGNTIFCFYSCRANPVLFVGGIATVAPIHRTWKVLGVPLFFCTLNAAAVVSLIRLGQGQRYTVWQPTRNQSL